MANDTKRPAWRGWATDSASPQSMRQPGRQVRVISGALAMALVCGAALGQDGAEPLVDLPPATPSAPAIVAPVPATPRPEPVPVDAPAPVVTEEPSAPASAPEPSAATAAAAPVEAPVIVTPPEDPDAPVVALETDLNPYPVGALELLYESPHPQLDRLAPLEELVEVRVRLLRTADGAFVAPRPGRGGELVRLADIGRDGPVVLYGSAIAQVSNALIVALRERSLLGVFVLPDPGQIDPTTETDIRDGTDRLTMVIRTTTVSKVRTIATNAQGRGQRVDDARHARIRLGSPVQAWDPVEDEGEARRDLLVQDPLERYALRLNRFSGRRVDVAIAPGTGQNQAEVQYLVREASPLRLYYETSNTGTEQTDPIRHRFGLQYSQLLNADDRASFEYITAGFDESHALAANYESSLFDLEGWRWRVGGGYSEFEASEVGAADETFTGESWFYNAEVSYNVFQSGRFFADIFGGVTYRYVQIINEGLVDGFGEEAMFLPRAGVRVERFSEAIQFTSEAFFEWTENNIASADQEDLERLGRLNPDREWVTFQGRADLSLFLEPLIFNDPVGGYRDPSTWRTSSLAHELVFGVQGQYAFNRRLIPNYQQVLGGLYSVRGYPESVVAGDNLIAATAEYRFHIPRAYRPASVTGREQTGFRWRADQVYGQPDWDLIAKTFVDWGETSNNRALSIEQDETLLSWGVGGEVRVRNNFVFRLDWGYVLEETGSGTTNVVTPGSQRVHFVLTVLF